MRTPAVLRQFIRIALMTIVLLGGLSTAVGKGNSPPPPLAGTPTDDPDLRRLALREPLLRLERNH